MNHSPLFWSQVLVPEAHTLDQSERYWGPFTDRARRRAKRLGVRNPALVGCVAALLATTSLLGSVFAI